MPLRALLYVLLLLAALAGCAGAIHQYPQLSAAECRARAEEAISQKNYREASAYLEAAIHKEPANAGAYLRHGEVLETLGSDRQARSTYRRALKNLPVSSERSEAAFRLALLEALKKSDSSYAETLLPELPEGSLEKLDLQGIVALQQGKFREALQLFSKAQQIAGPRRMGLILYHAALAYQGLGDQENTFASLFHAINQASNLAEAKDIERLYNRLTGR